MTYKIEWRVPERVIEVLAPPICDNAFVERLDADLNAMLSQYTQPVVLVYDLRYVRQSPSVRAAFNMTYYRQPNLASIVTIGMDKNPILRFLGNRVRRGTNILIRDFASLAEARAYVASAGNF